MTPITFACSMVWKNVGRNTKECKRFPDLGENMQAEDILIIQLSRRIFRKFRRVSWCLFPKYIIRLALASRVVSGRLLKSNLKQPQCFRCITPFNLEILQKSNRIKILALEAVFRKEL
jgi:hypothetical protein